MDVRGGPAGAAKIRGTQPSAAMRAYTRGPAMTSDEIVLTSPSATSTVSASAQARPPNASAANRPISSLPASSPTGAAKTNT